jgi:hypothetical protein
VPLLQQGERYTVRHTESLVCRYLGLGFELYHKFLTFLGTRTIRVFLLDFRLSNTGWRWGADGWQHSLTNMTCCLSPIRVRVALHFLTFLGTQAIRVSFVRFSTF